MKAEGKWDRIQFMLTGLPSPPGQKQTRKGKNDVFLMILMFYQFQFYLDSLLIFTLD